MKLRSGVEPKHIKAEVARRIEERYPLWRQLNAVNDGGDPEMVAWIKAMRERSNELEADPPLDYKSDGHWEIKAKKAGRKK